MRRLDPADIDLATLAWLAGSSANGYLLAAIRGAGHPAIRTSHGYVFQHLLTDTPTMGELAALLGVTQQAASKMVVELEGLGYVRRMAGDGDQRIRRVSLTPLGREAVAAARAARADLERILDAAVGPAAMRIARDTLQTLIERTGGRDAVARRRVRPPAP